MQRRSVSLLLRWRRAEDVCGAFHEPVFLDGLCGAPCARASSSRSVDRLRELQGLNDPSNTTATKKRRSGSRPQSKPSHKPEPSSTAVSQSRSFSRPAESAEAHQSRNVFVSNHYRLSDDEVGAFLQRHGIRHRQTGQHLVVEECPFCHDTRQKADNHYKLYIERTSGVYFCHRCGAKGSWYAFREHVGAGFGAGDTVERPLSALANSTKVSGASVSDTAGALTTVAKRPRGRPRKKPVPNSSAGEGADHAPLPAPAQSAWEAMKTHMSDRYVSVKHHLNLNRGINDETLRKYGVGAEYFRFMSDDGSYDSHLCYVFPMFDASGTLVRLKARSISEKKHMKLDPKGGAWGLFGLDTVPASATELVLTEGEFDAMAVHQATGIPAVSLPNGARSLPVSLLPGLERFEKIYLWMDDDLAGMEGARQFAKKLGLSRCVLVRPLRKEHAFNTEEASSCKDANEALLNGHDISAMLRAARRAPHEGIATFADLRDEIFVEFTNPLQVQGVRSEFLPRLNSIVKGHRRGELTVYSGHTGVGKTTLLSQMSLDYCMQGVPTLWGSFEISNVRIAKLLLSQYYARCTGKSPVGLVQDFDTWAEKFESLPLYFLRYFGSNPIDRVIDAMEYSNYVHDCSHALLDNLQFMTGGQARGADKFDVMDGAIHELRRFSTANNVHVSIVVHPRKENDDQTIQTASVFGSAKATQEADNLIILQRTPSGPVLDVRKNRFDGTLGTLNLRFNESSRMFEERDAPRRDARSFAALQESSRLLNAGSDLASVKSLRASSPRGRRGRLPK